jgi:hypothetical protein
LQHQHDDSTNKIPEILDGRELGAENNVHMKAQCYETPLKSQGGGAYVGVGDVGGGLECGLNCGLKAGLKVDSEYHSSSSFYIPD